MAKSDDDWKHRILCSDGNCIGIVGADGRCKACGKPYDGHRPLPAADVHTADDDLDGLPADQPITVAEDHVGDVGAAEPHAFDDSWENRTLCIDESCIGVVGPDGRCKECGKPYPG